MNADEIVKALRLCADDEPANCINCPGDSDISSRTCSNKLMDKAADLIESLQDELAESQRREQAAVEFIKYLDRNYSGYMAEDERFAKWRGPQETGKGDSDA